MKKLLLILSLIFLTSPALADHIVLKHGQSYTDPVVSCGTLIDAKRYIITIQIIANFDNTMSPEKALTEAQNNNCIFQLQHFVYLQNDYVCGFSILKKYNHSLLYTEVEGIKQYIIVYATASKVDTTRLLIPCIPGNDTRGN